jgi:hypothetical protein
MPSSRWGTADDVDVHAHLAVGRGLAGRAREPGTAEVLDADHEAGVEQLQAGLDEPLLLERVADLHRGALVRRCRRRSRPRPARDTPPMPSRPGGGARGAPPGCRRPRLGQHQALDRHEAEAQHVDQRVALVALVEHGLAADGGHADGVAVARDARHDALGDPPAPGVVERPEPQRVHQGDRPGAHGEDVAQDAARAGRRTLVGLDVGGVVVALDADGRRDAVTDVHDARRSRPGPTSTPRLGRESLQVDARRLVRAVLGPHHRVHRQLEVVRAPSEDRHDVVELVVGQPEGPVDRRCVSVGHGGEAIGAPERLRTRRDVVQINEICLASIHAPKEQ